MAWSQPLERRQGRAKAPGVIRALWGISYSRHLAEAVSDPMPSHRLPASSLVPLPYCKPILRCVWIGAKAFNASQNCALSALKISFTFFVVAGNITGRFRTQANGEHMVVGQACQQSFSRSVEHSGAAGVTSGQPLLPMWQPACCKAMELEGSTGSLLTALAGLTLQWKESNWWAALTFHSLPRWERTGAMDYGVGAIW